MLREGEGALAAFNPGPLYRTHVNYQPNQYAHLA